MVIFKAVYAFDVDDCLSFNGAKYPGAVSLNDVMKLRNQGIITGICGNYNAIIPFLKDWYQYFSFFGPYWPGITKLNRTSNKNKQLSQLKELIRAEKYVMVGNKRGDPLANPGSQDDVQARLAGWEFKPQDTFGSLRDFRSGASQSK